MSERARVDELSGWYLEDQLDFDRRMIDYRYRSIKPYLRGPHGLEFGPAEGVMTRMLIEDFSSMTVVDACELLARIPNLAGVKIGLLREPCELNEGDQTLGHGRVYTRESLFRDLHAADLRPTWGGVFFKPLSNQQIEDTWTRTMMDGFYELGKEFPEHANELYAICEAPA